MPFLLLFVLIIACLPENWLSLSWTGMEDRPWLSALATWMGVACLVGAAAVLSRRTSRRLQCFPLAREAVLQAHRTWRFYHMMALFGFFALALFVLGWGWAVQSLGPVLDARGPVLFPGGEFLVMAPFLVSLILSRAIFYDADRAFHDLEADDKASFWSRWAYVGFYVRQDLIVVAVPVMLLIAEKSVRRFYPTFLDEVGFQLGVLGLLVSVFIGLPWFLRLVLKLKPLPAGPLRDRLLVAAQRMNFRFSNILLWNTRSGVANAMVAGLIPPIRYVILTDRLLSELTPDEVEAVFGHEMGHVKHRHMLFYMGFLIVSLAVVGSLWNLATSSVGILQTVVKTTGDLDVIPFFAILGLYIFVVFGFLSRRCERQADIFGCRAVSCARSDCLEHLPETTLVPNGRGLCPTGIRTFIDALEKVAVINGINRERPGWLQSWQHSTIGRRVEFLQGLLLDPSLEPRFQRRVGIVKAALLIMLAAILVLLGSRQGWKTLYMATNPDTEKEASSAGYPTTSCPTVLSNT